MNVLVDSCVWSLALRRRKPSNDPITQELRELIQESRASLVDSIRQEVLSGIRSPEQFEQLRQKLRFFPSLRVESRDFEHAAEFYNACRGAGIQGSNTDFLICAVALRYQVPIFTTDKDFLLFAPHVPIKLYTPR